MAPRVVPVERRFWMFVPTDRPPDSCWLWEGSLNAYGYGRIHSGGRPNSRCLMAHRLSWEIHSGRPIPEGMVVCHECDTPRCVNPAHLFVASHAVNMADMASKGRQQHGERHAHAKLTAAQVCEIRRLCVDGETAADLAVKFKVSKTLITNVLRREGWRHLPDDGLQERIDAVQRARLGHQGSTHYAAKLTEADVREMRSLFGRVPNKDLARRFGISPQNVSMIRTGRSWSHVT